MPGNLLCVCRFPANTGYAWDYIERTFARLADALVPRGVSTWVAYPEMAQPPRCLEGSAAAGMVLDASLSSTASLRATRDWVRRHDVRAIVYAGGRSWHLRFASLRRAGVRRIVLYDHSSGVRTRPRGLKRAAKGLRARLPLVNADRIVAVSDFVASRHREVGGVPGHRVTRIWHGLPPSPADPEARRRLCELVGVEASRPLIAAACRATPEKGVACLLEAFAKVADAEPGPRRPLLVYFGDGPELAGLRALCERLSCRDDVIFAGYRRDAGRLVEGADVCVVPSLWEEAFGLAVLEPMALGRPVVASRVGGVPELIEDGVSGRLFPPGDATALAQTLLEVLRDPERLRALGDNARRRVAATFSPDKQVRALAAVVEDALRAA